MINTGTAFNLDNEKTNLPEQQLFTTKKNSQLKMSFTNFTSKKITTKIGADYIDYNYSQKITMDDNYWLEFSNHQFSSFIESELKISSNLAFKAGLRAEHSTVLNETNLMPRLSAAVKTGKNSQISMAFGQFRQNPEDDYLKFSTELLPEESTHSILTYQFKKDTKTLRIEAYNKHYTKLVKFTDEYSFEPGNFNNDGFGYSRGID